MDIKQKKIEKYKGIFLGAGFDMNFNLPSWENLISQYSSFLHGVVDIKRDVAIKKIQMINEMGIGASRKYGMLNSVNEKHVRDFKKYQFEKIALNINNYSQSAFNDILNEIIKIKDYLDIRIITTNISNALIELGFSPKNNMDYMQSSGTYLAIHGCLGEDEENIVLFEKQYVEKDYEQFVSSLRNFDTIHIFGYSLNDELILKNLKLKSEGLKIVYYYFYDDDEWMQIIEEHLKSILGDDITFRKQDLRQDNNYISLFKELIKNITDEGTGLEILTDVEDFFGGDNE